MHDMNHRARREATDQEERIEALKRRIEGAAKGNLNAWESDTLSPDQSEQFWQRVVDYETAPLTSHFQQLTDAGVELPDPNSVDDEKLSSKLWEAIDALARI